MRNDRKEQFRALARAADQFAVATSGTAAALARFGADYHNMMNWLVSRQVLRNMTRQAELVGKSAKIVGKSADCST